MKFDRLVSIIMLLDKERIGAQELEDRFEVSPRTIYPGIPPRSTGVAFTMFPSKWLVQNLFEPQRVEREFTQMK